ncbi:hypothetical protein L1077_03270 [Pseudoalteromonas luteoviolacea]|uniref:hypothetical protein n=1 Tax=Pseudoalteromonas luteoviolacea TaxID=43657 RepID=UPI001F2A8613|nr:hypothetical protein [Pseudoalteromonas luteoviolacea]MCF6438450.1 hypothetical protein [Pseudoalteromonas luteoviolacea]
MYVIIGKQKNVSTLGGSANVKHAFKHQCGAQLMMNAEQLKIAQNNAEQFKIAKNEEKEGFVKKRGNTQQVNEHGLTPKKDITKSHKKDLEILLARLIEEDLDAKGSKVGGDNGKKVNTKLIGARLDIQSIGNLQFQVEGGSCAKVTYEEGADFESIKEGLRISLNNSAPVHVSAPKEMVKTENKYQKNKQRQRKKGEFDTKENQEETKSDND